MNKSLCTLFKKQENYFKSGKTLTYKFRMGMLHKLKKQVSIFKPQILKALKMDLGKSGIESILTETDFVLGELTRAINDLDLWMEDETVSHPLVHFPGQSKISYRPKGVTLILSPWNYPFQLAISPLVGAIAAGNTSIIRPSELTPYTSTIIKKLICETFPEEYIACVEGGIPESSELLKMSFDHIFFTGSTEVGKIVMNAASEHLTPVTLELGGKSPCIVTSGINLKTAVKRIWWGKGMNAGQTCVAPDYILIDEGLIDEFLSLSKKYIKEMWGNCVKSSNDFGRIVNKHHFKRLLSLLDNDYEHIGGSPCEDELFFPPTLVKACEDSKCMEQEIFGPILPVISYKELDNAIELIEKWKNPLALYIFTEDDSKKSQILNRVTAGGVCVNDTLVHLGNDSLPFGGFKGSGQGKYHGKFSFLEFSHVQGQMHRSLRADIPLRYPPFSKKKTGILKKILSLIG